MIVSDQVNRLLEFRSNKYPITSFYMKLGPGDRENYKYKIAVKNLMKEQREVLSKTELNKGSLESVESDFKRVAEYFENTSNIAACRGIAIFSCSGEKFWEVFKLPLVYRDRLAVGSSPNTRQILRINDEYGDIAVILIDRKKAKLYRISLNKAEEILGYLYPEYVRITRFQAQEGSFKQRVAPSAGGGKVSQGYGEYGFQRMIENEMHQHFKYVSGKLFDYYKNYRFDWLIIGGAEQFLSDFSNHLHTYLAEINLGTIVVDIVTTKPDELVEQSLDLLEVMRNRREDRLVREFEEKLGSRFAINGIEPTLRALMRGQVRILLVEDGFSNRGFKCPETGFLVLEEREGICPEGVKPLPVLDIVDEVIEEALGQKSEVVIVTNQEGIKKIDGIGAILRFKS